MARRSPSSLLAGAFTKLIALHATQFGALYSRFLERVAAVGFHPALAEQSGGDAPLILAAAVATWGFDAVSQRGKAEAAEREKRADARKAERLRCSVDEIAKEVTTTRELLIQLVSDEEQFLSADEFHQRMALISAAMDHRFDILDAHLEEGFALLLDRLANKEDVEALGDRMDGRFDEVLLAVGGKPGTAATLDDYLLHVENENRELLLEPFRIGERVFAEPELVHRLLSQVFVQIDVRERARKGPTVFQLAKRLESALLRGLGDGDNDVLWMPFDHGSHWIANEYPLAGDAAFEVVPIEITRLPTSPPEAHSWVHAHVEGGDLEEALQQAGTRRRLVLLLEGKELRDPLDRKWTDVVRHVRERAPGARVLTALRTPALSLEQLLALDPELHGLPGRYVVRGHPGTGKTTVLRHAALSAVGRARANPENARVPIVVDLPKWARKRSAPVDRLRDEHSALADDDLRRALLADGGARLLLLFDGLDEVRDEDDRDWIGKQLRQTAADWPSARIVVATRKIGYKPLPAGPAVSGSGLPTFAEVDLLPLDVKRQRALLLGWLRHGGRAADAEALAARILRDLHEGKPAFDEMRGVPLLLTFVAMLYEEQESNPDFRLTRTRTALYAAVLEHLMQGRHRRVPRAMQPPEGSRRALQLLAERCMVEDGEEPTRAELVTALTRLWSSDELEDVRLHWRTDDRPPRPNVTGFLKELAEVTGIVVGDDRDGAPWRFWHRTLREALVARRFAEEVKTEDGRERVLARAKGLAGKEAQWAEPFALFVGLTDERERDGWLLELAEQNHALALRALASVEGVSAETIETILRLDGLDQEARCAQYGEVHAKLGGKPEAAPAAAKLLGRLAEQMGDCMDLWHVALALDELERGEPGAADDVRRARSRPFEHGSFGPRIDADALAVPEHPEHAYWRDVPAGTTFWMGTDEEEGPFEDEGPRHEVRIERAFQIAAVPVTNALWARFRKGFDADEAPGGPEAPVTDVSWYDAAMFCAWLDARLPSEAEWEGACRAGATTRFWSGDADADLARVGWFADNTGGKLHPVAQKPHNALGLFDMHGNVWEWCQDHWHGDYQGAPGDGSAWEGGGSESRVNRGGSFRIIARCARSAYLRAHPELRLDDLGFRPARPLP
jgi:hypothetical protein